MVGLLKWSDEYAIGIDIVDEQHQYLFKLFNDLEGITDSHDFQACFMKLYRYAREHFSAEEQLMKDCHYPLLAEHRKQHDQFIFQLNSLSIAGIYDLAAREDLKLFLSNWLVFHILGEDLKIAHYLENK